MKKYITLPESNINLFGAGLDINGNSVIKLSINANRAFSLQTNIEGLFNTKSILTGRKTGNELLLLSFIELYTIRNEVYNYINQFGTKKQKESIKLF